MSGKIIFCLHPTRHLGGFVSFEFMQFHKRAKKKEKELPEKKPMETINFKMIAIPLQGLPLRMNVLRFIRKNSRLG